MGSFSIGAFGIGSLTAALVAAPLAAMMATSCSSPDNGNSNSELSAGDPSTPSSNSPDGTSPGGGGAPEGSILEPEEIIEPEEVLEVPEGCGDGVLADTEVCDDGNTTSGDGCAMNCGQLEPGFSCAEPGQACIPLARCGDGFIAPSEMCDDANTEPGDGCSERCRVEQGSKCEGVPSTCSPTTCGDGIQEGAEACDDGNNQPFDGCSALCLSEPDCQGFSCTSECGDGLVIDEECDDGNRIDGDGCSSSCTIENGFTCERATACEMINDECILRVPAVFRDFSAAHPDFGGHNCSTLAQGAVERDLNAEGKPVMNAGAAGMACLSTAENFSQWYSTAAADATLVSDIVLFDNGRGGFVNRFDDTGAFYTSVGGDQTHPGGMTLAACEASCAEFVSNEDFSSGCDNHCNMETQEAMQGPIRVADAQRRLEDAIRQFGPGDGVTVPPEVAAAQAELDAVQAASDAAVALAAQCLTDCDTGLAAGTAACASTCQPCSVGTGFCTFGMEVEYEGNPLFFPVDSLDPTLGTCPGTGGIENCAKLPAQYGHPGWPFEHSVFENAPQHNFYFTSEVQYWFQYDADTNATLDFTGDDDVWVFINGKLAVDIGGIHVPVNGSVSINAAASTLTSTVTMPSDMPGEMGTPTSANFTAADFGLEVGQVYLITVFHAERQKEGSSFRLTLSGFEAAPSDCSAICGDGILSFGEECDDGINDGGYGECDVGCILGPFCGDGIVQEHEECDEGPGGGEGCPNCRRVVPPDVR